MVAKQTHDNTPLSDALSETSQEVNRQPDEKAIVVFTDGDDNASVLTAQAAVNRARKNEFPLFTPVEGEGTQSQQLKKILSDLSKSSGGEAYEITRFWSYNCIRPRQL